MTSQTVQLRSACKRQPLWYIRRVGQIYLDASNRTLNLWPEQARSTIHSIRRIRRIREGRIAYHSTHGNTTATDG